MAAHELIFDAVAEARPGTAWAARWRRSWPDYEAWFAARGGDCGPARAECEAALEKHMPELAPVHRALVRLAGGSDRAARFLSTWCPPRYLGGCSIAALATRRGVRLIRNYDLSPDLNEGLLLRSEWTGRPVMGMVEFLWGLSDGVNESGLAVALAHGGRPDVARGFGVTTILRYVLETCATVPQAIAVLRRVPSHMAYNVTLADRNGATATVELHPGGDARVVRPAVATNHQLGTNSPAREHVFRSTERRSRLEQMLDDGVTLNALADAFLAEPLFQSNYDAGFGTLFTAVYDPVAGDLILRWPDQTWSQSLAAFSPGTRTIRYGESATKALPERYVEDLLAAIRPYLAPASAAQLDDWAAASRGGEPDWTGLARVFAPRG